MNPRIENVVGSVVDAGIAAKRAEMEQGNWLARRLQKRAVGRRHKPGIDYVAMKAALAAREAELQKAEDLDKMTNEGAA